MLNPKRGFVLFIALIFGFSLVLAQDNPSSPSPSGDMSSSLSPSKDYDGETDDELYRQCVYLNTVRTNFTACCDYPVMVIWRWQLVECQEKCEAKGKPKDRCCVNPCCFSLLGMYKITESEDGTITSFEFDLQGLIFSFLLSVGNDSAWLPVVSASTTRCYEQFGGNDLGFDCGVIPKSLYDVFDCTYAENYIKCARWNPHNLVECDFTYQYVVKCMIGYE